MIILVASCCDGIGGVHFEKLMRIGNENEIDDFLSKIPPKESIPEQWCVTDSGGRFYLGPLSPGQVYALRVQKSGHVQEIAPA